MNQGRRSSASLGLALAGQLGHPEISQGAPDNRRRGRGLIGSRVRLPMQDIGTRWCVEIF